ncbi:hypothetical protein KEM54_006458 [Ascosphaera aggregata]|nr:hypothetical protein KEM54_006458 [Ascosphaera aggregata]
MVSRPETCLYPAGSTVAVAGALAVGAASIPATSAISSSSSSSYSSHSAPPAVAAAAAITTPSKESPSTPLPPTAFHTAKSTNSSAHHTSPSPSSRILNHRLRLQLQPSLETKQAAAPRVVSFQTPSRSNDFPVFNDTGDVEILIASPESREERRYLLHQLILSQCSNSFKTSFGNPLNDIDESASQQSSQHLQVLQQQQQQQQQQQHHHHHHHHHFHQHLRRTSRSYPTPSVHSFTDIDVSSDSANPNQHKESSWRFRRKRAKSNPEDFWNSLPVRNSYRKATRWKFELDWASCKDGDGVPMLVKQRPSSISLPLVIDDSRPELPNNSTKPHTPRRGFFRTIARLTSLHDSSPDLKRAAAKEPALEETCVIDNGAFSSTLRDYDNLFRIFYNYPPSLNSENISTAYQECKSLLNLADMYDALPAVAPRVDHHLLRFSSRLFKHISEHPLSYLKLGYLAKSKVIFCEAMIHLVGQWPEAKLPSHRIKLPAQVLDLISLKVGDLGDAMVRTENRLLSLTLSTSLPKPGDARASIEFLAESVFRQWLINSLRPSSPCEMGKEGSKPAPSHLDINSEESSSRPPQDNMMTPDFSSSGRTFRLIAANGPDTYLGRKDLKQFIKHFASKSSSSQGVLYTRENAHYFEQHVDKLKREARAIVTPLTRSHLEMDASLGNQGGSVWPYLTCTVIEDSELPWNVHDGIPRFK